MKFGICIVAVAPMRLLPDHREELTSQFLFGESAAVVEIRNDGWLLLQHQWDGYMGWCRQNQFYLQEHEPSPVQKLTREKVSVLRLFDTDMILPLGSVIDPVFLKMIDPGMEYNSGLIDLASQNFDPANIHKITEHFINSSYLWGGRSIFGIDCSAFVQSVYRLMNVKILRDSRMQVTQGDPVGFLQEAVPGDLAFFEESSEITHVGILLNDHEIIHAAGKVRIDKIDSAGIINSSTGARTHYLRIIKRIVSVQS